MGLKKNLKKSLKKNLKLRTKVLIISLLSFSTQASEIFCTNTPSTRQGLATLRGKITGTNGKFEVAGDGIYFSSSKKENVTFFRNKRENEDKYKFAKFTGGSLFHLFFLSVPKTVIEKGQQSFPAYLTFLREGVGGKEEVKLSCKTFKVSFTMNSFINEHRNLITWEHLSDQEKKLVTLIEDYNELPKEIKSRLEMLELSIMKGWDLIFEGKSNYVVNFENGEQTDGMKVIKNGELEGYIFNVTECNPEECYGWDSLYLDERGNVLWKSF